MRAKTEPAGVTHAPDYTPESLSDQLGGARGPQGPLFSASMRLGSHPNAPQEKMEVLVQGKGPQAQGYPGVPAHEPKQGEAAVYISTEREHPGLGEAKPSGHSGRRRPRPATPHLGLGDARRLAAAVRFADAQHGLPGDDHYWRGVTLNLTKLSSPLGHKAVLRALVEWLRKWQQRHDCPAYWVWVSERGSVLGDHIHLLAAVNPEVAIKLGDDLREWLAGPKIKGTASGGTVHTRQTSVEGWRWYGLKTMVQADAATLREEYGIRVGVGKPDDAVTGRRVGICRGLGPQARETARSPSNETPASGSGGVMTGFV